jgi:hypothetical protein
VVTSATYVDKAAPTVVGTSVYTASWGTVYETPVVGGRWWGGKEVREEEGRKWEGRIVRKCMSFAQRDRMKC